jgi:L-asparaginase
MGETSSVLHFVITGGTIDSFYDPVTGRTLPCPESNIPSFVALLKLYEECVFTEVCMKDSRDLTDDDRSKIVDAIASDSSRRVIVTHGSYTVATTAELVQDQLMSLKTVIFVCAMVPIKGFDPSDAGFNLGYAVSKSQDLPAGVYVCMNGRVFHAGEVTKILADGRFGSKFTR